MALNKSEYSSEELASLVDSLIAELSATDEVVRAEAARQLCNLGERAQLAFPRLIALKNDPWFQVRIQVVRATIHIAQESTNVDEVLQLLVSDEEACVRSYAKEALRIAKERRDRKAAQSR